MAEQNARKKRRVVALPFESAQGCAESEGAMTELITAALQGMTHGWLQGVEAGVALCMVVVVIAVKGALGRAGRKL